MRVITFWFTLLSSATRMESVGAVTPADSPSWDTVRAAALAAFPRVSSNASDSGPAAASAASA